jgi:hypothetical protein
VGIYLALELTWRGGISQLRVECDSKLFIDMEVYIKLSTCSLLNQKVQGSLHPISDTNIKITNAN